MDHLKIIKDIRNGKYAPLYLLHGTESFYIDEIVKVAEEEILDEAQKAFNFTMVYGKDADSESLGNALRRYPMMAPYQLIILKEAQDMRTLKDLEPYAANPNPTTIFFIAHKYKKLDGRSALIKQIKKHGIVYESKALRDYQMSQWISEYIQSHGYKATHQITALIAESLGTDLSKVSNELEKLFINLPSGTTITKEIVQAQIGISKDYNVFELNKALAYMDVVKANRIINYFIANPKSNPFILVNGMLFKFFSEVYMTHYAKGQGDQAVAKILGLPYHGFVKDYREACRNYSLSKTQNILSMIATYDLKSKGYQNVSTENGELLREMVFKILH
ncbi:MAG: DNA polymerase III subunit delta [Bacteroidia bacterium]|nr:DNA polymerase III subunit delta [Bacteroidia bacterium]